MAALTVQNLSAARSPSDRAVLVWYESNGREWRSPPVVAALSQRRPGVWLARTYLPPVREGEKGRQDLQGTSKKAIRSAVAEWEPGLRGTAPRAIGATVADLLELWQQAKEHDWQPTTTGAGLG